MLNPRLIIDSCVVTAPLLSFRHTRYTLWHQAEKGTIYLQWKAVHVSTIWNEQIIKCNILSKARKCQVSYMMFVLSNWHSYYRCYKEGLVHQPWTSKGTLYFWIGHEKCRTKFLSWTAPVSVLIFNMMLTYLLCGFFLTQKGVLLVQLNELDWNSYQYLESRVSN